MNIQNYHKNNISKREREREKKAREIEVEKEGGRLRGILLRGGLVVA